MELLPLSPTLGGKPLKDGNLEEDTNVLYG